MRKIVFALILLISLMPMDTFAAEFDYGYFGVTQEDNKSLILWAEYPYNRHQFESVDIASDGSYLLRQFGKKGGLLSQRVYQNNQQFDLTEEKIHGIQIQLLTNRGSYARLVQATTTNPLSETVNFFEEPF